MYSGDRVLPYKEYSYLLDFLHSQTKWKKSQTKRKKISFEWSKIRPECRGQAQQEGISNLLVLAPYIFLHLG